MNESQPEGAKATEERIPLTDELRLAANAVEQARRQVDWDELREWKIESALMEFDGPEDCAKADRLLHKLALANLGHRTDFSRQWVRHVKDILEPLRDHIRRQLNTLKKHPKLTTDAAQVLTDALRHAQESILFFKAALKEFDGLPEEPSLETALGLWEKLNNRLKTDRSFCADVDALATKTSRDPKLREIGLAARQKRDPVSTSLTRIGKAVDDRIYWPLKEFAIESLKFCAKIAASTRLVERARLPAAGSREISIYAEVFHECGLLNVKIGECAGVDPAITYGLDAQMVELADRLNKLFTILAPVVQRSIAKPAAVSTGHALPAPVPVSPSRERLPPTPLATIAESPESSAANGFDEVEIADDSLFTVSVNGTKIGQRVRRRALLALAIFAPVGKAEPFEVIPRKLSDVIDGPSVCGETVRQNSHNRFRPFKAGTPPWKHFKKREHEFSGLFFLKIPDRDKIKAYLAQFWKKSPNVPSGSASK
jgi:hypothetical protein